MLVRTSVMAGAVVMSMAGASSAALVITPSDVLAWSQRVVDVDGTPIPGYVPGALPQMTWTWGAQGLNSGAPIIDASGRVYFVSTFVSDTFIQNPLTFTNLSYQTYRGVFTATNSTDVGVYNGLTDGRTLDGRALNSSPSTTGTNTAGISTSGNLRVSGNRVSIGVQVSGSGIVESNTSPNVQNNSFWYSSGTSGGALGAQIQAGVTPIGTTTINGGSGTAAGTLRSISNQNLGSNRDGAAVLRTTVNGTTNTNALIYRSTGGSLSFIYRQGDAAFGSTLGSSGFLSSMSRSGQVAFDAQLNNVTGVVDGTNSRLFGIFTPGSGTTWVARQNDQAPGLASGTLMRNGQFPTSSPFGNSQRSFGDAGFVWTTQLANGTTGGDVVTTAGQENDRAMYISTTSGSRLVSRRNDLITTTAAGEVRWGLINSSSITTNNQGWIATGASLQGSGVTANVGPQATANGPIPLTGVRGNDSAIVLSRPDGSGGFLHQVLARSGDAAPYFGAGWRFDVDTGGTGMQLNNVGTVLFTTDLSTYAAGDAYPAPGNPGAFGRVLWSYNDSVGKLLPLLYQGMGVEVDAGIVKRVSQFTVSNQANGDGTSMGLNDNNEFTARLSFTDGTFALVKLNAIPAPGAGAMAVLGLGGLARRRRR